jgi:ferredoxin
MKQVTLEPLGRKIEVKTNERVLDAILSQSLPVLMACGGKGLCATCHVWVEAGADKVTPLTEREKRTLARVSGANECSRLSCQARILGEGVVVKLPDGMYIESTKDLESYIGKRAADNILHPVDGRVLVQRGKIITRSRIMELSDVDVDMAKVRAEAAKL